MRCTPLGGSPQDRSLLVGGATAQLGKQDLPEQVVIPILLRARVERHKERVRFAPARRGSRSSPCVPGRGRTAPASEPVEGRGPDRGTPTARATACRAAPCAGTPRRTCRRSPAQPVANPRAVRRATAHLPGARAPSCRPRRPIPPCAERSRRPGHRAPARPPAGGGRVSRRSRPRGPGGRPPATGHAPAAARAAAAVVRDSPARGGHRWQVLREPAQGIDAARRAQLVHVVDHEHDRSATSPTRPPRAGSVAPSGARHACRWGLARSGGPPWTPARSSALAM